MASVGWAVASAVVVVAVPVVLIAASNVVSFDSDGWQLDPRRDNLIRSFPFEFWYDATVTVVVRTVLSALVVGGAALIARRLLGGGTVEPAVP